jgi:integrase
LIGMPRPRPPNLHREMTRHGSVVWYVRVGKGPRIRIKAVYGTPKFDDAYNAAILGEKPRPLGKAAKGTLEWLWMLYRQASAWTELSLATRRQRENIMSHVLKSAGQEPLSKITKKSVEAGVERRKAAPSQAKHFVASLRGMFEWALAGDLARIDPTHGISFKKSKKAAKSQGFPPWTEDDVAKFERRWPRGTRQRVMLDVFQYTGLRRGDAAVVGKQHVRNGIIVLDTEKTGMRVTIPILPEFQETLDAGPLGDLAFIGNAVNGNPMAKESLGNEFREACNAAGVKKSAHGLRKLAATRAANRGATVAELEAIFGWEGGQMASLYTRSANRQALSIGAINKLLRHESETSIPAPDDKVRERDEKHKRKQS